MVESISTDADQEDVDEQVENHRATEVHDQPQPPDGKGEPDGVAELDDTGTLRSGQVPNLAVTDTFTVTNEADLAGLDAQVGDVGIVTSQSQSYILTGDPSSLSNWVQFETPPAPVQDVFGRTGSVNPADGDYTAAQITNFNSTAAAAAPVQDVEGKTGNVTLGPSDVEAEPSGSVEDHRQSETHATAQPPESHNNSAHSENYTTSTEAADAAPVQSVNGDTGDVTINTDLVVNKSVAAYDSLPLPPTQREIYYVSGENDVVVPINDGLGVWGSMIDGQVVAALVPNNVSYQHDAETFATGDGTWSDSVGGEDMSMIGDPQSVSLNGAKGVKGDGSDDYGTTSPTPGRLARDERWGIAFTFLLPSISSQKAFFGVSDFTGPNNRFALFSGASGTPGDIEIDMSDTSGGRLTKRTDSTYDDSTSRAVVINKDGNSASDINIYVGDMSSAASMTTVSDESFNNLDFFNDRDMVYYSWRNGSSVVTDDIMPVTYGVIEFWNSPLTQSERENFVLRRSEV